MPVMRVFYTFYIHSSFHLCNSFIRVIRDFNIRGMTTNCSTSSVTGHDSELFEILKKIYPDFTSLNHKNPENNYLF